MNSKFAQRHEVPKDSGQLAVLTYPLLAVPA